MSTKAQLAAWAGVFGAGLALVGCQLVAPLPDADGDGEGGAANGTSTASTGPVTASATATGSTAAVSSVSASAGPTGPTSASSASSGGGACGNPTCDDYCGTVMDNCDDHPQYRSLANCCAVCGALGADVTCRTLPGAGASALACSAGGVFGPEGGVQCGGCADMCSLFAQACGGTQAAAVAACNQGCLDIHYSFDACAHLNHDDIDCRLQDVLRALDTTGPDHDKACKDAADQKCAGNPCN